MTLPRQALDDFRRAYYGQDRASNCGMRKSESKAGVSALPKWQIAVCLLLAALVVYNPFLAAADFGTGICVRHCASNRATVGASELQHFTPIDSRVILAVAFFVISDHLGVLDLVTSERWPFVVELAVPSAQNLPASLWFRPPPAV